MEDLKAAGIDADKQKVAFENVLYTVIWSLLSPTVFRDMTWSGVSPAGPCNRFIDFKAMRKWLLKLLCRYKEIDEQFVCHFLQAKICKTAKQTIAKMNNTKFRATKARRSAKKIRKSLKNLERHEDTKHSNEDIEQPNEDTELQQEESDDNMEQSDENMDEEEDGGIQEFYEAEILQDETYDDAAESGEDGNNDDVSDDQNKQLSQKNSKFKHLVKTKRRRISTGGLFSVKRKHFNVQELPLSVRRHK